MKRRQLSGSDYGLGTIKSEALPPAEQLERTSDRFDNPLHELRTVAEPKVSTANLATEVRF